MLTFLVFIFLVSFFPLYGAEIDECLPTRCRKDGPKIQFPFRHKYLQPQHCGYSPGFDLYCDEEKKETVLELPFSTKVVVQEIDYVFQTVNIYDTERCLPQKILNLSASPFQFPNYYILVDYILFSCSSPPSPSLDSIPCYSDSNAFVVAIDSSQIDHPYLLISCTKLHKISAVPWQMIYEQDLTLNWSKPSCGLCESQGKLCSFKNYTRGHQLQCVNKPETKQGIYLLNHFFPDVNFKRKHRFLVLSSEQEYGTFSSVLIVGLWCIQWYPADRPSMKAAVQMLERDGDNLAMPPNPFPVTNDTNSTTRVSGRRYQPELEIISETK